MTKVATYLFQLCHNLYICWLCKFVKYEQSTREIFYYIKVKLHHVITKNYINNILLFWKNCDF